MTSMFNLKEKPIKSNTYLLYRGEKYYPIGKVNDRIERIISVRHRKTYNGKYYVKCFIFIPDTGGIAADDSPEANEAVFEFLKKLRLV